MTEQLAVHSDQRRLGSITFDGHDDKFSLQYDPKWLEKSGLAISPHLKPGVCKSESIKRFLANLLPEGRWLEELSVDRQISESNIFSLIASIGVETTGSLTFRQNCEVQRGGDMLIWSSFPVPMHCMGTIPRLRRSPYPQAMLTRI